MLDRAIQITRQISSNMTSKSTSPNINLYTDQTPNGIKVSISLEELGYVNADSRSIHEY